MKWEEGGGTKTWPFFVEQRFALDDLPSREGKRGSRGGGENPRENLKFGALYRAPS